MTNEELYDYIKHLEQRIDALQREVDDLYRENIETSNVLYEIHNRIDMINSIPQHIPQPVVDSTRSGTFTEADFL